jgi:hypothetical protein
MFDPPLWELQNNIEDARDWLDEAIDKAERLSFSEDEGKVIWPAVHQIAERLKAIRDELRTILDPIVGEIKAEKDYIDEMSDRADAQSY